MTTEFFDYTHRDYRPNHEPMPTQKGVPVDFAGMTPQKAGGLICKCARKARPGNAKTGGHAPKGISRTPAAAMSRAANKK